MGLTRLVHGENGTMTIDDPGDGSHVFELTWPSSGRPRARRGHRPREMASMPEPIKHRPHRAAAADEHAGRAELPSGERGIDILVVDDQPDHDSGWFARYLPGHRRLSLESVTEIERFLVGHRLPNLPDPPYKPELAILDLSLGAGQPDGLQALHTLRQHPATRDLPAILNTNGLEDHRDMLAVIAAQINGGAIPVSQKRGSDGPAVRDQPAVSGTPSEADLPWPLTKPVPGLAERPGSHVARRQKLPVSLLDYLLDLPWKRTYWKEMARHRSHADAAFEARKRHGSLTDQDEASKQNHARLSPTSSGRSPSPGRWPATPA